MKGIIYRLQKRFMRSCGDEISYMKMKEMLRENKDIIVIDVRTNDEYMDNHIPGAINIPLQDISDNIEKYVKDKNSVIITYCEYGGRGRKACNKLDKMGYKNVYNLEGGMKGI